MLDYLQRLIRRYRSGVGREDCIYRLSYLIDYGEYSSVTRIVKNDSGECIDADKGYYLSGSAIAERLGITYNAYKNFPLEEILRYAKNGKHLHLFNWR